MPRSLAHKAIATLALIAGLIGPVSAGAQTNNAIAAAQKRAYPGVITLEVDATDIERRIFRVRQAVPARPGPLTLLYPRWLPGTHGPYGNANDLAGLQVRAAGKTLPWQRDAVEPHAFHVQVPAGSDHLNIEFQYLSPTSKDNGRRVVMTPQMLNLQWDKVVLYPAGHESAGITVAPRLKLPAGWQHGSALRGSAGAGADGWWTFDRVSLETLVDSPVFAGRHYQRVDLDASGAVLLHLMADEPEQLKASEEQLAAHRALVAQADRLFGARHFRHYDFLLALSSELGGIGLEHHQSSENGVKPGYFKDWQKGAASRELLPHEYTHSWNGKFRRPVDLWTPDFNTVPMRNSLLWLYEGQTQYWGRVLAARSALVTPEQARDGLANAAAWAEQRAGRAWRNLQDTTNEATLSARGHHKDWRDWQRSADYYDEAALIWLDADTLIRERTGEQRSMDDFARAFFGMEDGRVQPLTYNFDDVARTLRAVLPHDWTRFLRERLDGYERAPLDGLARSGWKLAYSEQQSESGKAQDAEWKSTDFIYSLGLRVGSEDQKLKDVKWDGPAFRAGLAPGAQLLAVNGIAYKPERLSAAISANKAGDKPIELLVRDGDAFRSVRIDYRDGLRYPRLERIEGTRDRLSEILSAR